MARLHFGWFGHIIDDESESLFVRTLEVTGGSSDVIGRPPTPLEEETLRMQARGVTLQILDGGVVSLGEINVETPQLRFLAGSVAPGLEPSRA